MTQSRTQQLFSVLWGRLARNIYFWVGLFILKQLDLNDEFAYSNAFYYGMITFMMLFFILLTYFNNFVLVPFLLYRKRWFLYIISAVSFTYVIAFAYVCMMKALPLYFPGFNPCATSIIVNPMDSDLSLNKIIEDTESYYSLMLVWVLIFTLLWYANNSVEKMKQMQEVINKHLETELLFLKNQINPHFLFNTLNNLYALTLKKSDDAPEAILKLASILRYMLYESNTPLIPFVREKEVMQAYIDIELLRIKETDKLNFSIMAEGNPSIPPLLWLPVLENVFKHGANQINDDMYIDFRFTIQGNTLTIYSKNNTRVHSQKQEEGVGGIGLTNLRKRLELLYPGKHTITSSTENHYFTMQVQITLS